MRPAASITHTGVPGAFVVDLPVHSDDRGSFTEVFRLASLVGAGLPELTVVQHNVAVSKRGVVRGIHAEPWDKYVTTLTGRIFEVIVDLRAGESFARIATVDLVPGRAVFIPRGCGNAYQSLEDNSSYSYLVSDYWTPSTPYAAVHAFDPALAVPWPIPESDAILSAKDAANPPLSTFVSAVSAGGNEERI